MTVLTNPRLPLVSKERAHKRRSPIHNRDHDIDPSVIPLLVQDQHETPNPLFFNN